MSLGLTINGVAKSFDGTPVLHQVSLEVPPGQATVLIGRSATGKTVLLRCILGLLRPDAGTIHLGDSSAHLGDSSATFVANGNRIGVLFQRNALFDSMTVWENVAFQDITNHRVARHRARDKALAGLAAVGLSPEMAHLQPSELSGGMQKRAALARAMASEPDLLLLDDPTAGLDPILTTAILDLIDAYAARSGATVFAITGDMKIARSRFTRIAMLHEGMIRWAGESTAAERVDDPVFRQLLLRHSGNLADSGNATDG